MKYEMIFVAMDLTTPILDFKLPAEFYWYTINKNTETEDNKVYLQFLLDFNQLVKIINTQIVQHKVVFEKTISNKKLLNFLLEGNEISILKYKSEVAGWVWNHCEEYITLLPGSKKTPLQPNQIYFSKWFFRKRFLLNRNNPNISLAWIQLLKKYYRNKGYTEGVAYVDNYNRGALKSILRAGFKKKNWLGTSTGSA